MSTAPIAISTSVPSEMALTELAPLAGLADVTDPQTWPLLPVETEIYILPDGRVVVADLPAELAPLLAALGIRDAAAVCAIPPLPTAAPLEATADDE